MRRAWPFVLLTILASGLPVGAEQRPQTNRRPPMTQRPGIVAAWPPGPSSPAEALDCPCFDATYVAANLINPPTLVCPADSVIITGGSDGSDPCGTPTETLFSYCNAGGPVTLTGGVQQLDADAFCSRYIVEQPSGLKVPITATVNAAQKADCQAIIAASCPSTLLSGLTDYWPVEDGGPWADLVGSKPMASTYFAGHSAPEAVAGKNGQAQFFDGTNSPTPAMATQTAFQWVDNDSTTNAFALSFWFRPDVYEATEVDPGPPPVILNYAEVLRNADEDSDLHAIVVDADGYALFDSIYGGGVVPVFSGGTPAHVLFFYLASDAAASITVPVAAPINFGEWNHVVLATDASNHYYLWVNGVASEFNGYTFTDTYGHMGSDSGLQFGGDAWPGQKAVDEPTVWSRVPTGTEIACLWSAGAGSFYPWTGVCQP